MDLEENVKEANELSDGWHATFVRDADERFVTLTIRHPYPTDEALPEEAHGLLAQIQTLAFAVNVCAQQGILPGQRAMSILADLGRAAADAKADVERRIITVLPG